MALPSGKLIVGVPLLSRMGTHQMYTQDAVDTWRTLEWTPKQARLREDNVEMG